MPDVPINKSEATWRFVTVLARSVVGVAFGFAGLVKLGRPEAFATDIRDYELLPERWTNLLAYWVPWIELIAAVLLTIRIWRREARVIVGALLVTYLAITVSTVARGLNVDCACFANTVFSKAFAGAKGIVLDVFLLGCLAVEYVGCRRLAINTTGASPQPSDAKTE